MKYNYAKIEKIFNISSSITKTGFLKQEATGVIPTAHKDNGGTRYWTIDQLPAIGQRYGFLNHSKLKKPTCISVLGSKGGISKSTITFSIARTYALSNFKTIVVGLDYSGDISNQLSGGQLNTDEEDESATLENISNKPSVLGLYDLFMNSTEITIDKIIQKTEIPTLDFIPETHSLNMMAEILSTRAKREYWLKDNVIKRLKKDYDLIILDLSPAWNLLQSNAIVASDVLLAPLETRIFHFQNHRNFVNHLNEFQALMELKNQKTIYIPTRYSPTKKLSGEIRKHYLANLPNCCSGFVRESNTFEEANAQYLSVIESAPQSIVAQEMRELISEIHNYITEEKAVKKWH